MNINVVVNEADIHVLDGVYIYKGNIEFSIKNSEATVYDLREVVNELHMDIKEHFLTDTFMENSFQEVSHWNEIDKISIKWDDLSGDKINYHVPFYIVSEVQFDKRLQEVVEYYTKNFESYEKRMYHRLIVDVKYYRTTFDLSIPSTRYISMLTDVFYQDESDLLQTVSPINADRPIAIHSTKDIIERTGLYAFSTASLEGLDSLIELVKLHQEKPSHYNSIVDLEGIDTEVLAKVIGSKNSQEVRDVAIDNKFLLHYFIDIQDLYYACGRNAAINVINQHAQPILTKYLRTH